MRLLVLGAGAIGGYFGARIHAAGGDVTFLVRPGRAAQMRERGLRVASPFGDLRITPKVITQDQLSEAFELIILSCKAYDLASAMAAIAPAVGGQSLIAPLLNGVRHIDALTARFGRDRTLGGVAQISAALEPDGAIRHLNQAHDMIIGALDGTVPPALETASGLLAGAGFDFSLSDDIVHALWDKMIFLTTLAGATCLMRADVGTILATRNGKKYINALLDECLAIAEAHGHVLSDKRRKICRDTLNTHDSPLLASMLRDVEAGKPTEAEHILGDMLDRADAGKIDAPRLSLAYSHLQAYERRRQG
ncbi:MAG: 2-dehydropantoate 2-reductase [Candidatus Accumulibacter sp.]|jgi:2-dehydropantoate 2-reductase|nr:2-dehydropantoate 2-reductase [Accumulibacter sp.]